jgi:hypothetical protein
MRECGELPDLQHGALVAVCGGRVEVLERTLKGDNGPTKAFTSQLGIPADGDYGEITSTWVRRSGGDRSEADGVCEADDLGRD